MNILTKELIRKSEESAVSSGAFSFRQLMYKAGTRAGEIIHNRFPCENKKIAVLCGKGNNGGDGFCIADYLYGMGADVTVITPLGKPETEDAKYYYQKLKLIKIKDSFETDDKYDIIIDAIYGIGYTARENKAFAELTEAVNSYNAIKIAVDIPSGVEANSGKTDKTAFLADFTVTFITLKPCFVLPPASDYCGETVVADIGVKPIEQGFKVIEKPVFKKRRHNSHKGDYGTALIIAGSYGMAGAAVLAAKAALRSGLGIAKCLVCEGIYAPFTASIPEAVCIPCKQTENGILNSEYINIEELSQNCSAILIGCGLGKGEEIRALLSQALAQENLPVIIDADGINALALCIDILKKSKASVIITPHPGEMSRLTGKSIKEIEENRIKTASDFAKEYGCTVVLKGANTVVASSNGEIFFNMTGNSGMATGGSGDVLSGITVSLLAQGYEPLFSAKAAVYLHGTAADKAVLKRSRHALLPSDIIEEL